jgi:Putative auto-transporter adhesin, head GIN domain
MRKGVLITIVVVAFVIIVAGAWLGIGLALGRATGPVVSEERDIPMFSRVDLSGEGTLIVTAGDAPELRVEAQQAILDRLETTVDGDTLRIRLRWSWFDFGGLWINEPITYYLTAPDLQSVELSGSTEVLGQSPFAAEEFLIDCSGSTDVSLEVRAVSLSVDTSGSSDVTLTGQADTLAFDTSGSTTIVARDLVSRVATIDCSGSSEIEVNVTDQLNVDASGSSTVLYLGDPTLNTDISGSGEIRRLEQ